MRGGIEERCLWALETFDFLVFTLLGSGAGVVRINAGCVRVLAREVGHRAHVFYVYRAELQIQQATLGVLTCSVLITAGSLAPDPLLRYHTPPRKLLARPFQTLISF